MIESRWVRVLLLVLIAAGAAGGIARADQSAAVLGDGVRALAHGDAAGAETIAREHAGTSDATVLLARLALRSGRADAAAALLAPLAAEDPIGDAALDLALLELATGKREAAARRLDPVARSADVDSAPAAIARAARAAQALGDFRVANQLYRRAARDAPSDPAIQTAWGELFLEKHNADDAARSFGEALKDDPKWAPAHAGLARALADSNPPAAAEAAGKALEIDPGLAEAHVTIARLLADASHRDDARAALSRALAINPAQVDARALAAALDSVDDKRAEFETEVEKALAADPRDASVLTAAADLLARQYRFPEAAAIARRAVTVDPADARAQSVLGMTLMRTGDEAEARQALDTAFRIDPYDAVTYNLLALLDTLDLFDTADAGPFRFRFQKNESPVLREYAPALAREAFDTFAKRYGFTPGTPILVEVFPRHDDFAVRTLGLPGLLGALGACFGSVVTMDSPKARPPNTFSWQATLWHELAHVFTLQLSNQRVPRWLTEGISEYEERRAHPEWGRDEEIAFARAWRGGKLPALRDLNSGFMSPDTIALSYYQASIVVEYLQQLKGDAGIVALLRAYGDGMDTASALQKAYGLTIDAVQTGFDNAVRAQYSKVADAVREVPDLAAATTPEAVRAIAAREPGSFAAEMALGRSLASTGDRVGAAAAFERAALLVPDSAEPHVQLAAIATAADDTSRAVRELRAVLARDGDNVDAARQLMALTSTAGEAVDPGVMREAAARVVALDPFDASAHAALGRAMLADGDSALAGREFRAALLTGPADAAAAHCDLAEALFASGEKAGAKKEVLASLEVAPRYERAQDLLLKIVEGHP